MNLKMEWNKLKQKISHMHLGDDLKVLFFNV